MAFYIFAITIFWRKSDDWMAIFVSLSLVTFGLSYELLPPYGLAVLLYQPAWRWGFMFIWTLGWASLLIFFFIFPNGQFVPGWTRWLAAGWVVYILSWILVPTLSPYFKFGDTPYYLHESCILVGIVCQAYRYKRVSNPAQRQQTKVILFGFTLAALAAGIAIGTRIVGNLEIISRPWNDVLWIIHLFWYLLNWFIIPVSIGVAVLRSRLWDINPIVNQTLVYGLLTTILALIYIVGIVVLQQLLQPVSGGSELAIVASTLTIAALFTPLRRRIQRVIDKRFYRRKYDAAKVLAAFGTTVRDETNLDRLMAEVLRVVDETMQPEFVSLWMPREPIKTLDEAEGSPPNTSE